MTPTLSLFRLVIARKSLRRGIHHLQGDLVETGGFQSDSTSRKVKIS